MAPELGGSWLMYLETRIEIRNTAQRLDAEILICYKTLFLYLLSDSCDMRRGKGFDGGQWKIVSVSLHY